MSGTAFFVTALKRRGVSTELCMATLLLSLIAYYGAYLLAALASVLLLWLYHAIHPWIIALSVVFALDAATLWVMLHVVGFEVSFRTAFPSFVLASMVATIGPIPLGLGTFEVTCVSMLGVLGVPVEAALTATLLLRGFTLWVPMLPGM